MEAFLGYVHINPCKIYILTLKIQRMLIEYKSLAVAEMSDCLATVDMGRKVGEGSCCAPFRGGWVPV